MISQIFSRAISVSAADGSEGTEGFVRRLYELILEREADSEGLLDWTSQLNEGRTSGADVSRGFIYSDEFKERNLTDEEYVEVLYQTFLDRNSDEAGKAYWMNYLSKGITRDYVFAGFVNSSEFDKICSSYGINHGYIQLEEAKDQNADITLFVIRCYEKFLGRGPDALGLNDWTGKLLSKENDAKEVARGFVFSNEFQSMDLSNEEYLQTMYHGLFDRDADTSGLNNWLAQMQRGMSKRRLFSGFADSEEFRTLARSFGLDGGWPADNQNLCTITDVLGVSGTAYIDCLAAEENTDFYLGTPYELNDWRSPNGDPSYNGRPGMNCSGFVWYTFVKAGANPPEVPHLYGAPNCTGEIITWAKANGITTYDFWTKEEMLSSGILEKGDIIWIWDKTVGRKLASDWHHSTIYWGDGSSDSIWHSAPNRGNAITDIHGLTSKESYTVIKNIRW